MENTNGFLEASSLILEDKMVRSFAYLKSKELFVIDFNRCSTSTHSLSSLYEIQLCIYGNSLLLDLSTTNSAMYLTPYMEGKRINCYTQVHIQL